MILTIDITREDYADFNKFHFFKKKLKRTIIIGATTLLILQLLIRRDQLNLTFSVFSSILFVSIYIFMIYRGLNKTKNIPDKNGSILGQKVMEFSLDKISYKTTNSEGSSDWTTIKKLEESSKAFYLYMDTNLAMVVPKRVFKDKSEEDAFKSLVVQKVNTI